ncbi:MAG: ABC transporter ATP-binding protein [Lachnospiraceae bacterium]|nr:ABC transporter ATP-binding protein [Lachnospiraceae bacterium]
MSVLLREISFSYGEKKILDKVSLAVCEKEHIGILGGSGCGKSTLLKILAGLYPVKDGYCEVAGACAPEGIRKQVAMVMQTPGLFPLSIRENITCGHPIAEEKVWQAVRAAQLEEWVRGLPEGLNSLVGERGGNLSGGQAQRIAIARAIAKDAPVVLLDEPTSALDGETAEALLRAMDRLTEGKTVIHVTHREETIRNYDRILVLKEGTLFEKESVSGI